MSYSTTITTIVRQAGLSDISSPATLTGIQIPPLETTITFGSPLLVKDGIGVLGHANLQMLTLLSDNLDATVTLCSDNAGATPIATIALVAGYAYEWDTSKGASPLGSTDCLSIKVVLSQTVGGVASTLTTSGFHARSSLSG